jgi:hypothetical protein
LTGLAKVRFEAHLVKRNRALLHFTEQAAQDDLLPICLPGKIKKPKMGEASEDSRQRIGVVLHWAETAEIAADKAERSNRTAGKPSAQEVARENSSDEDIVVAGTHAKLIGESREVKLITLALRTPESLRPRPNLGLRASPKVMPSPEDLAWQVLSSTGAAEP